MGGCRRRWTDPVTTEKREVVVEPRRDCCPWFAEECLEWCFEKRGAVGVKRILLVVEGGDFGVLSLFGGCGGFGIVV